MDTTSLITDATALAEAAESLGITVDSSCASGEYGIATDDDHDGRAIAYWLDDDAASQDDRQAALDDALAAADPDLDVEDEDAMEVARQEACDAITWRATSPDACLVLEGRVAEVDADDLADAVTEAAAAIAWARRMLTHK